MAARMAGFNPAMEAAIQPIRRAVVTRRVWMAGSGPGHDELGRATLALQHEGVLSEVIVSNVITR